jgi:hypothetical protein
MHASANVCSKTWACRFNTPESETGMAWTLAWCRLWLRKGTMRAVWLQWLNVDHNVEKWYSTGEKMLHKAQYERAYTRREFKRMHCRRAARNISLTKELRSNRTYLNGKISWRLVRPAAAYQKRWCSYPMYNPVTVSPWGVPKGELEVVKRKIRTDVGSQPHL